MNENFDEIREKISKIIKMNNEIENNGNHEDDENLQYNQENNQDEGCIYNDNNSCDEINNKEEQFINSNDVLYHNEIGKNIEIIDSYRNNCLNNSKDYEICTFRDQILIKNKDVEQDVSKFNSPNLKGNEKLSDYIKDELYNMTYQNLILDELNCKHNSCVHKNSKIENNDLSSINRIIEKIINSINNLKDSLNITKIQSYKSCDNLKNYNIQNFDLNLECNEFVFNNNFHTSINTKLLQKALLDLKELELFAPIILNNNNYNKEIVFNEKFSIYSEFINSNFKDNSNSLFTVLKNQEKIIEELIEQNKLLESKIIKYKSIALSKNR